MKIAITLFIESTNYFHKHEISFHEFHCEHSNRMEIWLNWCFEWKTVRLIEIESSAWKIWWWSTIVMIHVITLAQPTLNGAHTNIKPNVARTQINDLENIPFAENCVYILEIQQSLWMWLEISVRNLSLVVDIFRFPEVTTIYVSRSYSERASNANAVKWICMKMLIHTFCSHWNQPLNQMLLSRLCCIII